MNTIEKLTWQKKAGIISETQYRESVEALTSEESVRNMIKEALVDLLAEKKKAKKDEPIEEPEEGAEEATTEEEPVEGEEDLEGMEEPADVEPEVGAAGGSAQDVQKELMDALEAAKGIGDVKLQRQISNALTYFTRQQVASSEIETSTAQPAL